MRVKIFDEPFEVTQKFGVNPQNYIKYGFKAHEGIDLIPASRRTGVKMYSPISGVVVRDQDVSRDGYGIFNVIWNEEKKIAVWMCHMKRNYLNYGDEVRKGEMVVGLMGGTGNVTGDHLHLMLCETDKNGVRINTDNGYKGFIDPWPLLSGKIEGGEEDMTKQEKRDLEEALELARDNNKRVVEVESFKSGSAFGKNWAVESERLGDRIHAGVKKELEKIFLDQFALKGHTHNKVPEHTHGDIYALRDHRHDDLYSQVGHTHENLGPDKVEKGMIITFKKWFNKFLDMLGSKKK